MAVRKPVVVVQGPKTANLLDVWGDTLTSIRLHDAVGYQSDSCTLTFSVSPPFPALPPKGTTYTVSVGWSFDALAKVGVYTVQNAALTGDPDSGVEMTVECRAADLAALGKSFDSRHWDNKTVGEIVADVAKSLGMTALVAPVLRSIKIPYVARLEQEAFDFLSDVGDAVGGAIKAAGGRISMTERGSGKSASGLVLPTIRFSYDAAYGFDFRFEPRGAYETSEGRWYDEAKGEWVEEKATERGKGRLAKPHPAPSREEAKKGASALGDERGRQSATGEVEGPGDPAAVAGCPVEVAGFGPDADGTEWIAESIEHDIVPDGGWTMRVSLETKGGAKE